MNRVNERRKANYISSFDFSTLYTKLLLNNLLMLLNNLIDFCFDGREINFFTGFTYSASWVKNKKNIT